MPAFPQDKFSRTLFALTVIALWAIVFRLFLVPPSSGAGFVLPKDNAQIYSVTNSDSTSTVFVRDGKKILVLEKADNYQGSIEWQIVTTLAIP